MSFGNYSNELNATLTLVSFSAVMAGAWLYERAHPGASSERA